MFDQRVSEPKLSFRNIMDSSQDESQPPRAYAQRNVIMESMHTWLQDALGPARFNMFAHNPEYWGGVIFLALALTFVTWYLTQKMEVKWARMLALIGSFVTCCLLGLLVGIEMYLTNAPRESSTPLAETDPLPVVQEAMLKGMNELANETRERTINPKTGKKSYGMEWVPGEGYQPVAEIGDMGVCVEAMTYSVQILNAVWQQDPESVKGTGKVRRAYDIMSSNLVALRTGLEPFMAARFEQVVTSNRDDLPGRDREKILVWLNTSASNAKEQECEQGSVPYKAAVHFDSFCAWLTPYFEISAYPHIARLCADFLEGEGHGWQAWVPGNATAFADGDLIQKWDPSGLPEYMPEILAAIRETGELPKDLFWERSRILIDGCEGTPFRGQGFGHNLGVLLWGPYFESYFGGDPIKAARAAAFLAANPKARFNRVPNLEDESDAKILRDWNRKYVTSVANWWWKLWKFRTHALGYEEEDPSMGFLQFLQEYTSMVLPSSGQFQTWTASEFVSEVRRRRLLPEQEKLLDALIEDTSNP